MLKHFNETIQLLKQNSLFQPFLIPLKELTTYYNDPVRVLIMGEFSVGKSSLINALLEKELLASSLLPTTAVTTFIKFSQAEKMEVYYIDGTVQNYQLSEIAKWTSERDSQNKQQRELVKYITLYVNHPLLKNLVLIDSPGLNSINKAHTNQTTDTLDMTDDILFVFAYGKVGQVSELDTLHVLSEKDYSPLGVINMMDSFEPEPKAHGEEIDYDAELKEYYDYEFNRLKPNVRKIIGVSASDALYGFPRQTEEQQQYYEMSEFPVLLQELQAISDNTSLKNKRFGERLLQFLNEVSETLNKILASETYLNEVQKIKALQLDLKEKTQNFKQQHSKAQQQLTQRSQKLITTMTQVKIFEHWIYDQDTKIITSQLPYSEMQLFMKDYKKQETDVHQYEQARIKLNNDTERLFGMPYNLLTRLNAETNALNNYRQDYKNLKNRYDTLLKRAHKLNERLVQYEKMLQTNASFLKDLYQQQFQTLQNEKLQLNNQVSTALTKNKQLYEQHKSSYEALQYTLALASKLSFFGKEFRIPVQSNFSFAHANAKYELDQTKKDQDQVLHSLKSTAQANIEWNHQFKFPKQCSTAFKKPKNYLLYSIRIPAATVTAGALAAGIYYGASAFETYKDDFYSAPDETYYEETDPTTSYAEAPTDESINYLTPAGANNSALPIGQITVYTDVEVFYDNTGDESANQYLQAGSTWDVYEQVGDWYRIQQKKWVYLDDAEDFTYSGRYYAQDLHTENILGYILSDGDKKIYREPNGDLLSSQLEPLIDYEVYAITDKKWVKIGDNAWIQLDEDINFVQLALSEALITHKDWIQAGTPKQDPLLESIPIFSAPDSKSAIIGFYEGESGTSMPIYDAPNGEWVNIGENAWIQAEKYLDIDWTFYGNDTGEEALDSAKITTPTLIVRTEPTTESNMIATVVNGTELEVYEIDAATGWYRVGDSNWISNKSELVNFNEYSDSTITQEAPIDTNAFSDLSTIASQIDYDNELGYIENHSTETLPVYGQPTFDSLDLDYLYPGDTYTVYGQWEENWYQLEANRWIYVDEIDIKFYAN